MGTSKITFVKCILEKNKISTIIDLINVHFNRIYANRIIEINKFNCYKFNCKLLHDDLYVDDRIFTNEFIKYSILENMSTWYCRNYKFIHNKINFTDELLKMMIENNLYNFICIYERDIGYGFYTLKISDEIWDFTIQKIDTSGTTMMCQIKELCAINTLLHRCLPKKIIDAINKK